MIIWQILKSAASGYLAHGALSRGAAISFYSVTSLAPVLLIVIAVAGLAFGQDAVRGSLVHELRGLLGKESADLVQSLIAKSSDPNSGAAATVFGLVMVLITASGVFSELQAGLNEAWGTTAPDRPLLSMIRARALSLGLVGALGFLLMVSSGRQHCADGPRQCRRIACGFRAVAALDSEHAGIGYFVRPVVRRNLQGAAGHADRLARCSLGGHSHQPDVHGGQVADRLVPWSSSAGFDLRRCGLAACDLLGVHHSLQTAAGVGSPGRLPKPPKSSRFVAELRARTKGCTGRQAVRPSGRHFWGGTMSSLPR